MNDKNVYPYEELANKIISNCKKLDTPVFDFLPDDGQQYPFIVVGDQINMDQITKDMTLGTTNITIHVFSEWNYKHDVYRLLEDALNVNYGHLMTDNFGFVITSSQQSLLGESDNGIKLWHGRLELDIRMG